MSKTAIITGVTGQDGSYLADFLIEKNYNVIGLHRRTSHNSFQRIKHLSNNSNFKLEEFDITDPSDCSRLLDIYKPEELYNLAAQSHVGTSFKQPSTTLDINTIGVINLLEAIRHRSPDTRFYQASTSEMFGSKYTEGWSHASQSVSRFQNEKTSFAPQSPYAISKMASHRMVQIYREAYGLYACCGILFNHESPRRGENFVTRKITKYIAQLTSNLLSDSKYSPLFLGNINTYRDWGHAKDFVRAMYLMLQQAIADDYVIGTGKTHSVKEFLEASFKLVDLDYNEFIQIDPELYRPSEVEYLKSDPTKANIHLDWYPTVTFDELVEDMVNSDIIATKISI